MTIQTKRKFDRGRFQDLRSSVEKLSEESLVRMAPLVEGGLLPLVVEPAAEGVDLTDWVAGNRQLVERKLAHHGAVLFRGFGIDSPTAFENFASSISPNLFNENGEHPRESVSGNVYTPVFYPPDSQLLWHNENSFNHSWPLKIMFCAVRPADQGGETPLVDSRELYRRIDPKVRARFEELGVLYVRKYGEGPGLDWRTIFQTSDRREVERRCAEEKFEVEWKGDALRTRGVRPAVVAHPSTGELSWFNQAQHWHPACLEPEVRASLLASFSASELPRDCHYGDGSPIEDSVMEEILEIYRELEVVFPWQVGDVVVVDNVLVAHGRNPFVGERKLLVAMADMTNFDQV